MSALEEQTKLSNDPIKTSNATIKPSYEQINYRIRPAKSIERKLLAESFRRLIHFDSLDNYRYVGFGSTFFSDFILFHKALGIDSMVSIEKDAKNEERFTFNKPYKNIEIRFGTSSEVLPELKWKQKNIIWLDYDGSLDLEKLEDVRTMFMQLCSGSVVIISCNVHSNPGRILGNMQKNLGHKFPSELNKEDLEGWKTADVCRKILINEIEEVIQQRNIEMSEDNPYKFQQLYNFHYSDGAKMLTFGGILYEEKDKDTIEKCKFDKLKFIAMGERAYRIVVPSLTFKEIRHINTQLPNSSLEEVSSPGISLEDIKHYAENYKYFPSFLESEI